MSLDPKDSSKYFYDLDGILRVTGVMHYCTAGVEAGTLYFRELF